MKDLDEKTLFELRKDDAPEGAYSIAVSDMTVMGLTLSQVRGLKEFFETLTGRPVPETIGEIRDAVGVSSGTRTRTP